MAFNNFGCTISDVLAHFVTGCNAEVAVESQLGGETIINNLITNITNEVAAHICANILNKIVRVEFEQINPEGGLASTVNSVTAGLSPVSSVIGVWNFSDRPVTPPNTQNDLSNSDFSSDIDANGVLTITRNFSQGTYVYLSYELDTDNPNYSIPSLASIVCLGAVARLGPKIYSDEAQWKYLETIEKQYEKNLKMIENCDYRLPELSTLRWWQPINDGAIVSIPLFRG